MSAAPREARLEDPLPEPSLPVGEPVEPGDPARRPERRRHAGRYVALEPVRPDADAGELYQCSHGDEERERLWTYMPYGPFPGASAMATWLGERARSEDPLFLAVVELTHDRRVGMVSFLNGDATMRRVELGHIWYGPAVQRTRINTETVYLMLRHAFDELGYRRVEWKCDALNQRSRRAALRLGFGFEGVFRQHVIVKGRNRDTAWYAMLDRDWPELKRCYDEWLYRGQARSLGALTAEVVGPS